MELKEFLASDNTGECVILIADSEEKVNLNARALAVLVPVLFAGMPKRE